MFKDFIVIQVLVPLLSSPSNHVKWPQVVAHDVKRHVGDLKSDVFVLSGLVKGKTLLPLPPQVDAVLEAAELQLQ